MSGDLAPLAPFLARLASLDAELAANAPVEKLVGSKPKGDRAMTSAERQTKFREQTRKRRKDYIAVLDMETDPFDKELQEHVYPFTACLYSDHFPTQIFWERDHEKLCRSIVKAINDLPDKFTIYAHNGGRFDFLFFVSHLRGEVKFKGRGIMSARIGNHELRDSFHIIPEKLAAFQKDHFDYQRMRKDKREDWKKEIIEYMTADCRYLLRTVKAFVDGYGFKLSIGQAAMAELKKSYTVKKLNQGFDKQLRQFYFGGRVECLRGRGHFQGSYKLYDVNSEYPFVMANYAHPIGDFFDYDLRRGKPNCNTVFLALRCENNNALVGRMDTGETTTRIKSGKFLTTIWEYDVAVKYGLIRNVEVLYCMDCKQRTYFSNLILPLYDKRMITKNTLADLKKRGQEGSAAFVETKMDDIFLKLLLNNSYGKFAQNPENYKEHFLTDPDDVPPDEWLASVRELEPEDQIKYLAPLYESERYWIYHKPNPGFRYNNVGTAASITGAARAYLLEGLQHARNPIYCDTDSIICEGLDGVDLDGARLGAWDMEDEFSEVVIDGKKLYSVWHKSPKFRSPEQIADGLDPRYTVKSKGGSGISWQQMLKMLDGAKIEIRAKAPTLTKFNSQAYINRVFSATAPIEGLAQ